MENLTTKSALSANTVPLSCLLEIMQLLVGSFIVSLISSNYLRKRGTTVRVLGKITQKRSGPLLPPHDCVHVVLCYYFMLNYNIKQFKFTLYITSMLLLVVCYLLIKIYKNKTAKKRVATLKTTVEAEEGLFPLESPEPLPAEDESDVGVSVTLPVPSVEL